MKYNTQVSIQGSILTHKQNAFTPAQKYKIELKGLYPSHHIILTKDVSTEKTFIIDIDLAQGKYILDLISEKNSTLIDRQEIQADPGHDRFELVFKI